MKSPPKNKGKAGRSVWRTLLFAALFLLLLLGTAELTARFMLSYDPLFYRIRGRGDTSFRLDWVRRHRRDERDIMFEFDIYHPSRGWAVKPGITNARVFGDRVLHTNSRGIRDSREFTYERKPGVNRILAIGDSFTFGEEVSNHETFPHLLEAQLENTEVLNLGVHGYGHDQILLYLKEEGLRYQPDIVLLGFLYYDMERNIRRFRDYAKPRFRLSSNGLRLENVPVPEPVRTLAREPWRLKIIDLLRLLVENYFIQNGLEQQRIEKLSTAILDEMIRSVREAGAVPVFVYLPNEKDFKEFFDEPSEREQFFLDYCAGRQGLHCLSIRPAFVRELKRGRILDYYGHWDVEGNRLAADVIRTYFARYNLLPDTAFGERTE